MDSWNNVPDTKGLPEVPVINPMDKVLSWNKIASQAPTGASHQTPTPAKAPPSPITTATKTTTTSAKGGNPKTRTLQDIVVVHHDCAWREEIEIEMRGENDESFNGTITMVEAGIH